jgi:hypothetical protein
VVDYGSAAVFFSVVLLWTHVVIPVSTVVGAVVGRLDGARSLIGCSRRRTPPSPPPPFTFLLLAMDVRATGMLTAKLLAAYTGVR